MQGLDFLTMAPRVDEASRLMQMLSNPSRLKLLCVLAEGEMSVMSLAEALGMPQPAVSQQLKLLREAGLVSSRRVGQTIYNRVQGEEAVAVIALLHRLYCQ